MIDKTATYVAQSANPPLFEDKVREGQRSDPKFSFLNPADPYHAYYRHKMDKIFQGDIEEEQSKSRDDNTEDAAAEPKIIDVGLEPPVPEFILDMPNISAIDLCVA